MNWGKWKLKPQSAEEVREVETIQGMRKRLNRFAYENALVKAIFDAAHYRGLSGEDTMTWLAFEALQRVERLEELMLDEAMTRPKPPLFMPQVESIPRQPSSTPREKR